MSVKPHLTRFAELRGSAIGDPNALPDDRLRVLWVLAATKDDLDLAYMTSAQISEILCDGEGIHLSRQRVAGILQKERGTVAKRRHQGCTRYKIMRRGIDEITPASLSSIYVDPERALTQIRKMEEILASLKGDLKICDPYIENKTIDFIAECRSASSIKLLSSNVLKETKLRRDFAPYDKEYTVSLKSESHRTVCSTTGISSMRMGCC